MGFDKCSVSYEVSLVTKTEVDVVSSMLKKVRRVSPSYGILVATCQRLPSQHTQDDRRPSTCSRILSFESSKPARTRSGS